MLRRLAIESSHRLGGKRCRSGMWLLRFAMLRLPACVSTAVFCSLYTTYLWLSSRKKGFFLPYGRIDEQMWKQGGLSRRRGLREMPHLLICPSTHLHSDAMGHDRRPTDLKPQMDAAQPAAATKLPLAKSAKSAKKASMKTPFNLGDLRVFARGITSRVTGPYQGSLTLSGENFQLLRHSSADKTRRGGGRVRMVRDDVRITDDGSRPTGREPRLVTRDRAKKGVLPQRAQRSPSWLTGGLYLRYSSACSLQSQRYVLSGRCIRRRGPHWWTS